MTLVEVIHLSIFLTCLFQWSHKINQLWVLWAWTDQTWIVPRVAKPSRSFISKRFSFVLKVILIFSHLWSSHLFSYLSHSKLESSTSTRAGSATKVSHLTLHFLQVLMTLSRLESWCIVRTSNQLSRPPLRLLSGATNTEAQDRDFWRKFSNISINTNLCDFKFCKSI